MVDINKCHTFHPILPATEPLSLGQLRKGGSDYLFQGTFDNKKIFIQTTWASNFLCIYNRICQVRTPRTADDEEQIDLEPEQLTLFATKTVNNATSSRQLVATTRTEPRDVDSENFRTGSICQNGA